MNAVNLIPADRRSRRTALAMSPAMLAVVGVLVLVLVGAVLYVSASNSVSTRRTQLAQVTSSTAAWNAAAAKFGVSVQAAEHHSQELADIRQLIVGRFPWSELLGQVGSLMPAKSELTTMQATTTSGTTSGATPTPSTTPGATATASATAGGPPIPSVTLTGCANSQSTVADVMVQLHRITDVTNVSLASSTDGGSASGPSAGAGGGCTYPVQFQLSLTFKAAAASAATTASGAGATPASTSTGTGSRATASVPSTRGAAQ